MLKDKEFLFFNQDIETKQERKQKIEKTISYINSQECEKLLSEKKIAVQKSQTGNLCELVTEKKQLNGRDISLFVIINEFEKQIRINGFVMFSDQGFGLEIIDNIFHYECWDNGQPKINLCYKGCDIDIYMDEINYIEDQVAIFKMLFSNI